jgi:glycosyltransferase involved in cell wall biosynthesis
MRLLVITAFYPPHHSGGFEMRCRDVVEGLIKRGHTLLVITNTCADPHCALHVGDKNIHRVLHQRAEAPTVLAQIAYDCKDLQFIDREIKEFNPDIIYLWHIQNLSNAILPYFSGQPIPLVYDEGGAGLIYYARILKRGIYFYDNANDSSIKKALKSGIYRLAELVSRNLIKPRWAWPQNMRVYFNSRSSLQNSLALGAPVENALVIPSGIDVARFPYVERNRLSTPIKIIVPGRIKPEKGTLDAVRLVKELINKKVAVRLKIIGEIQSGDYFGEITEAIHRNKLDEFIEYQPMVSQADLARFYQEADICFFPTYFKSGFSRVPLEAMSSGCLVVAYGNEGSREVIQDHETGFMFPEGDVLAVAGAIESLMERPQQYRLIIQKARLQVTQMYSMERYNEKIEQYLMESLAGGN